MWRVLLQPVRQYLRDLTYHLLEGWNRFWFTPTDPTTLACIRICTGLVLLYIYATVAHMVPDLIGPDGWVDLQASRELRDTDYNEWADIERAAWRQSIWLYIQSPTGLYLTYGAFLLAIACYTLGLFSRVVTPLVWIGHLSFVHRGYVAWYGIDSILAMLLLYQLFAPVGATLSLDRWLAGRRHPEVDQDPPPPSIGANISIRLIQVHMCIVYFCAGMAKLQGPMWWNGTATYYTMMIPEFAPVDMRWLANMDYTIVYLVSLAGTAFTLFFEIVFAFLIWNRWWRPILLFMAVMLHGAITLFMGLGSFGVAMLTGCMSFVPPDKMKWFLHVVANWLAGKTPEPTAVASAS